MCIRRRGWFVIRRGNATVWRGGTARKVRFPRGFHAFPSRDRRKYESDEPCGEGGRGSARECKVGRRTSGCERGGGGGRKVQAGDLALSEWKRGVEHAATARRSTHLSQGHILDPHRGLPCVSGDARADERRAVGAHRPFAATHALFSPDLCNARTCATPSLQAVSSLLYRSGASNFDDRPVLPYLPSRARDYCLPIRTIRSFSSLSFPFRRSTRRVDREFSLRGKAEREWRNGWRRKSASAPFFLRRGRRGRARELRVRPRSGVVATLLPFPRTKGSLTRWRAYAWPADPDVTRGHVNRG